MGHYNQQEIDFVRRTKKILEQYDKFKMPNKEKFEVTLLLNCLVGLLILPQQHYRSSLPTDTITEKEWGISYKHVWINSRNNKKSVKNVARHLRNSLAHYKFHAYDNSSRNISGIIFEDYNKRLKQKTFKATIPLKGLRKFVSKLSDHFVNEMKTS